MTTRFFETQTLDLTPLTPIHIGCGIDFEPTNYVIDDGVLFQFDPAQVVLSPADRKALLDAVNAPSASALRRVQAFFHERGDRYAGAARHAVAVADGVAEQYLQRIGRIAQIEAGGRQVQNQLEIERSAHHPHTGEVYLPGSSLKGAMRTAWLDALNNGRSRLPGDQTANALERRLLEVQRGFETDPFRLVHVADAAGHGVLGKVYFSTNHKKRLVMKDGREVQGQGPTTRREAIVGGQHAAMTSEVRLDLLPDIVAADKVPRERIALHRLADACNRYYVPRLLRLLDTLEQRGFAHPEWVADMRSLVDALATDMSSGHGFLLRVGRHSGAESVTLDGVREIRIMQGRGMPAKFSTEGAGTLWLAAEHENTTRGALLPFGWLLARRADAPELHALREWCDRQPKPDLAAVRARLEQARAQAAELVRRVAEADAKRRAEAEAKALAERAEQERVKALSPNMQAIEALQKKLRARAEALRGGKDKPNTALHGEARMLAKRAVNEAWPAEERRALADMLEANLPGMVQIDWKDERKKLQIALLRG